MRFRVMVIAVLGSWLSGFQPGDAQTAAGGVVGRVTDVRLDAIPGVGVEITSQATGQKRACVTGANGEYSAPALPPGHYQVIASASRFATLSREVIVEAGSTTVTNLTMQVGAASDSITVTAATPLIHHDSFSVSGTITRFVIDRTPLNGRDFLELAKLEPGAQQPARGSNNRVFVPLLASPAGGNNGRGTRVTVDGGSVMQIGNGGAAMGFSQEVVREFEVCTANCGLKVGMAASGSINVATRSGENDWHGSGLYLFRDHFLSAYPALTRDPFNPHPYFQRQQYGAAMGGPIRKNRVFFFTSVERDDQQGVVSTELLTPEFASMSRITSSSTIVDQFSIRFDWIANEHNSVFVRGSHEGSYAFAPTTVNGLGQLAYPSAWTQQPEWTDQSILGWTSQLTSRKVNDLRFSYFFVSSAEKAPVDANCPGCLGIGAPALNVADLSIGTSTTTVVLARRFHLNDMLAWQVGTHNFQFGGDWETTRGGRTDLADQPVVMNLYSPQDVRNYNLHQPLGTQLPLPASYLTVPDLLSLPLVNFTVGIGNPNVPQAGFSNTRVSPLLHLFAEDHWHISSTLTLDLGVGWSFDAPLNYDLAKPAYLTSVLGTDGLQPTHKNLRNLSPLAGFTWSVGKDEKTVIRAGAGLYYDAQTSYGIADDERVSLGPRGVGRGLYVGAGIANPLINVPGVPEGTPLSFTRPTSFTGASLLQALPTIQNALAAQRGDPNNRDFSVTNIEVDKQGSLVSSHLPNTSSTQVSAGIQREIARDFVVGADVVFQSFGNIGGSYPQKLDTNHFFASRGPVLPLCSSTNRGDPNASCSLGPILSTVGIGHGEYRGLLVRIEKRYSERWQLIGSYAFSNGVGNGFTTGFNNDDPQANYGPTNTDYRHILSLSGVVQLPKRFELGFFATYVSRPPFSAVLGNIDLNGDGTTGDLLPGTTVNQFNRGLRKADLQRLVDSYNRTYAGESDADGRLLPLIKLPAQYEFGDPLLTQDFRLSRAVALHEPFRMTFLGEVFNLFNLSNLTGRSNNLFGSGFGQPKSRVTQVFGSGGPRAFQFGVRVDF